MCQTETAADLDAKNPPSTGFVHVVVDTSIIVAWGATKKVVLCWNCGGNRLGPQKFQRVYIALLHSRP